MKKLISAVLCLVLILSCSTAAFAAEKPTFTITPKTVEAAPGDIIEFSVSIETEDKCRTLGMIPQFDAAVFEVVEGQPSIKDALISTYSPGRGFVFLFAVAEKLKGEVLTIKLKVRDAAPAGTYEIDFKVSMKDKDDPIETEVMPAKITVVRSGSDASSKPTEPPKATEKPTEPPKATEPVKETKPKATEPAKETEAPTEPATEPAAVTETVTEPATEPRSEATEPAESTPTEIQHATEEIAPTDPSVTTPEETNKFEFPMWAVPVYAIGFALIIIILILKRRRR